MKVVIVTGSVCTGKTTVAKRLAKTAGFEYVDIKSILKKHKIEVGYDYKRKCKIIDVNRMNKSLIKIINERKNANNSLLKKIRATKDKKLIKNYQKKLVKAIIFDSHLSHYLPKKYVDLCIVTKCDLPILERRLKKRGYHKDKVRENMDVEIFEICLNEAREKEHKIFIIDTTFPNKQLDVVKMMLKVE